MNHSHKIPPFGFDPAWKGAPNELDMYNAFKMKLSIIIAVLQMTMGVVMSGFNARFFKKSYDFLYVTIPQLIFFVGLFGIKKKKKKEKDLFLFFLPLLGYLGFMVFFKWIFISLPDPSMPPTGQPPKLLQTSNQNKPNFF